MSGDAIHLDGKVAIVTGGAGGIGEATVRLLTARGARVAIADIAMDRATALATQIDGAIAVPLDLEDEASITAMIAQVVAAFGRLDVLHERPQRLLEGLALRGTFIINPEGVIKTLEIHSNEIARDVSETLRKLKAAQFTAANPGQVCPAKWKEGAKTLTPSLDLVGKI